MRLKKLHFEEARESKVQMLQSHSHTSFASPSIPFFWKPFSSWGVLLFSILQSETSQVQGRIMPSTDCRIRTPIRQWGRHLRLTHHCYSCDTGQTSSKWLASSPSKHWDLCCKARGLWSQRRTSCLSLYCRYNGAVWMTGNWTLLCIYRVNGSISERQKLNGRE